MNPEGASTVPSCVGGTGLEVLRVSMFVVAMLHGGGRTCFDSSKFVVEHRQQREVEKGKDRLGAPALFCRFAATPNWSQFRYKSAKNETAAYFRCFLKYILDLFLRI